MTIRKSTRKKNNRFEAFGENAVEEHKDSAPIDPSSNTEEPEHSLSNNGNNIKDVFLEFKDKTDTQFCRNIMEYTSQLVNLNPLV